MKLRSAAVVAGLSLCLVSGVTQASTFSFHYTANGIDTSGTIMATMIGANEYMATSITGMHGMYMINGLDLAYASADDDIFTSGPYLDLGGLSYDFGAGTSGAGMANVFYSDGTFGFPGYGEVTNPPDPGGFITSSHPATDVSFTMSTVPLPASAPMFGAALAALGVVGYRMKRKAASAA